jgi:hypothetical protein
MLGDRARVLARSDRPEAMPEIRKQPFRVCLGRSLSLPAPAEQTHCGVGALTSAVTIASVATHASHNVDPTGGRMPTIVDKHQSECNPGG